MIVKSTRNLNTAAAVLIAGKETKKEMLESAINMRHKNIDWVERKRKFNEWEIMLMLLT